MPPPAQKSRRDVARMLNSALGETGRISDPRPLEPLRAEQTEMPALAKAALAEGTAFTTHQVAPASTPGFRAFLDGIQQSFIVRHIDGVPLVEGHYSAAIRERIDRRMTTWRHRAACAVYAPLRLIGEGLSAEAERFGVTLVDTTDADAVFHPLALGDLAYKRILRDRERLEQDLAAEWCAERPHDPLFIDGPIRSSDAIGVIKNHNKLYVDTANVRVLMRLEEGQRTSVTAIDTADSHRPPVATWYLRLRGAAGRDPMWGLARIEVAWLPDESARIARANEISSWVLAERAPIALPDGRWDRMVYGIRDCEEFLKATA